MSWDYNSPDGNATRDSDLPVYTCSSCGKDTREPLIKDANGEMICEDCGQDNVSDCCGALPRGNGDNDTKDYGICPDCHDHCTYVKRSELKF